MAGVTAIFYIVSKFSQKRSVTFKISIPVQKHLFKSMLKSISKFPEASKI